jgi:hypothetical protein
MTLSWLRLAQMLIVPLKQPKSSEDGLNATKEGEKPVLT